MPSAKLIRIYGIVQGVGFRPFVARAAEEFSVKGSVANKGSYVEVHAQGDIPSVEGFIRTLKTRPPKRSVILEFDVKDIDEAPCQSFEITESEKERGDIFVSPDIATCEDCKRELFDKSDRRYHHPFINCTQCGPRLTILDSMPYDRERTSMGEFPMCPQCEREYTSPETRRYDAQPVCCNDCGPEVYILGRDIKGMDAIRLAAEEIMSGKIAAIKGIGGFHLCCDAKNPTAVKRLRELKKRPMKPFAVMMKDPETVRRECEVLHGQEEYLDGYQKPILLLKKKCSASLCEQVAPKNPNVGVMLPYAPVQMLLFDCQGMSDCLVMTSANASGAPICRCDEDAVKEISGFCDIILSHNRKIRLRADDSVMDWLDGRPYMIRRSRGFAPLPVMLSGEWSGEVISVGGELKNTFCIGKNGLFYLSPYVGDMEDIRTVNALRESIERMETLLEASPSVAVCDMHPKYNTAVVAEELGLPVVRVQHHYAHILSCMAENDFCENVIGVSFDGTGYGSDGTVWGGEFLICDHGGFKRAGSIQPFMQAGGDLSAKEGWRVAVQLLYARFGDKAEDICRQLSLCDEKTFRIQKAMADKNINCVKSTSCGRLFDGISAILGIRKSSTFEGEASMALEFAAESYEEAHPEIVEGYMKWESPINIWGDFFTLSTNSIAGHIADVYKKPGNRTEEVRGRLAYEFHAILADMIFAGCEKLSADTGISVCALSGGVFQNRLLVRLAKQRLEKAGLRVLVHSLVPPNDGGIALGQAVYAMNKMRDRKI